MTRWLLGCLALFGAMVLAGGATAYGAETHVFDATLSLTGGCGTSTIDPVRDPGPECPEGHPSKPFSNPLSVAIDNYGDIFVASYGSEGSQGAEGRIDVFDSEGFFITEIPDSNGPKNLVVDKQGNLYVFDFGLSGGGIRRYTPNPYNPEAGEIQYKTEPTVITEGVAAPITGMAINRANDRLFVHGVTSIYEFGSAAEGNKLLDKTIGEGTQSLYTYGVGLAVDAAHGLIFATDRANGAENVVRVYELAPPHKLVRTIDGSTTPESKFLEDKLSLAVDEASGHLYVYDAGGAEVVYEFTATGELVSTIKFGFNKTFGAEIAIDNGEHSSNGGLNPGGRYLYVPSFPSGTGHSFAFGPLEKCPPEIESASFAGVSAEDAELRAAINPCGLPTKYTFEYTTQEAFEAEGFAGASVAGEGSILAGNEGVEVSAAATALFPDTEYRFRVSASNEEGPAETEGSFTTYPAPEAPPSCPNDSTRTGASALLPDCRAYELVTPPDTNARTPHGIGKSGAYFQSRETSPAGDKVSFITEGGTLPGTEGTGSLHGDPYLATRGEDGWSSASAGPNGEEAVSIAPGSPSPDQGYSFWGGGTSHVRYPDGHSELVGRGSIADDPHAESELISENGGHVVFASTNNLSNEAVQLEPSAPPDGTAAIYDRTADEVTHVVSLLPGNVTPAVGQNAEYQGASLDGKGVAFKIGKKLYLRFNNEETYEIGEEVTFAGIAEGGARIFYLKGGDLFAFDAKAEETIQFTEAGDVTPVNIVAEGTAAYFVSPSVLTGAEENPNGDTAQAGKENLYLSREGTIIFVATVTERDVEGEFGATEKFDGLGLWTAAVGLSGGNAGRLAIDPSRTTPNGNALLFESRADLAGYDPEGHAEIYRYDSTGEELECLSCSSTQAPATSDASLQSVLQEEGGPEPFNPFVLVENLRADGERAFFQSSEQLVLGDTDGLQDVYEWEAQGVGSCIRPQGCVYLISSGHSARTDYLYGVSDNGNDVFFRTADLLLSLDGEETPSIYDARVGGGFPEPECEDSALCSEPQAPPPPVLPAPTSPALPASGNLPPSKACPKGKHKVTTNGKTRCVKNKKKHHKHHRAGSKRKGAGK